MDIESMTPEQLRAYAAEKEAAHDELVSRYMDIPAAPRPKEVDGGAKSMPWERTIEFEGVPYVLDMRRVKDERFVRLLAAMQASAEGSGKGSANLQRVLDMYDFIFADIIDGIRANVETKFGYRDYEEIFRIENGIFQQIEEAKN